MAKASIARDRQRPYGEVARKNISIGRCLQIIEAVDKKLLANHEQMDLATVPALRLLSDNQFRKLAKVLPDLKAIEHSGELAVDHTISIKVGA